MQEEIPGRHPEEPVGNASGKQNRGNKKRHPESPGTERDDKPLNYPLMYRVSDVVLISKIDTMEYFDFDLEKAKEHILGLNPKAVFFPISARTGEGIEAVCEWILRTRESIVISR